MKTKILVVDDDQNMIKLLNMVLQEDYEVETANDIDEAKAKIFSEPNYAVIILDLRLGNESGYDLIKYTRVESNLEWIPIIVLSGLNKSEERIKSFKMKADDYVVKPFNPVELRHRIDRHIAKYKLIKAK